MIEIVNALAHKYNNSAILYFEQKKNWNENRKKNSEREMSVINFNERVRCEMASRKKPIENQTNNNHHGE